MGSQHIVLGSGSQYMMTLDFLKAIAKRGFLGSSSLSWSNFKIGLATNCVLNARASLSNITELVGTGYSRLTISGWQLEESNEGPKMKIVFPTYLWENTGVVDWSGVQSLFVVGDWDATTHLCYCLAITPTLVMTPGMQLGLIDDELVIQWRTLTNGTRWLQ